MLSLLGSAGNKLKKPLYFATWGALGSLLVSATVGELFWYFTKGERSQTILVLIDTSSSMEEAGKLEEVRLAASSFIENQFENQNTSSTNVALATFGDEAQLIVEPTNDVELLEEALGELDASGGTRMDEGIKTASQALQQPIQERHFRHILLFTDGQPGGHLSPQDIALLIDTSQSMAEDNKFREVKQAAKGFVERQLKKQTSSDIQVSVVGFGSEVSTQIDLTHEIPPLFDAIDNLQLADGGGTNMGAGINTAAETLTSGSKQASDRHIVLFTDGQPVIPTPQSIVLLIDRSGSMEGPQLEEVKSAAQDFVQSQDLSNNELSVIDFGVSFNFSTVGLTSDLDALEEAIASLKSDGGGSTDMDQAIDAAQAQLENISTDAHVLLFTDGLPSDPRATLESAEKLRGRGIKIVAIGTGGADEAFLKEVTNDPSLTFYASNSSEIGDLFQQADRVISGTNKQATDETLEAGELAKLENINLIAVGTGDSDESFLAELTGDSSKVFRTEAGNFDLAFRRVETWLQGSEDINQAIADTLAAAEVAKQDGISIVAVGTGDAERNFLETLTGDPGLVFETETGNFEAAFVQAGEKINTILGEEANDSNLTQVVIRIGGWTAIVSTGLALSLMLGQNKYLQRRLILPKEISLMTVGSFAAGGLAGGLGQVTFAIIQPLESSIYLLADGGLILGWIILGLLLGVGLAFFIPNLKKIMAAFAGGVGGLAGGFLLFLISNGVLYVLAPSLVTVAWISMLEASIGRVGGATLLGFCIGAMIATAEVLSQSPRLLISWPSKEQKELLIGKRPIILGSSFETDIYLPKDEGYPAITAQIFLDEDKVIMQFSEEMKAKRSMKILRHELSNGDRRRFGGVTLEVKTS